MLLDTSVIKGLKRYVISSPASIYSDATSGSIYEVHSSKNKKHHGATKMSKETILRAFHPSLSEQEKDQMIAPMKGVLHGS